MMIVGQSSLSSSIVIDFMIRSSRPVVEVEVPTFSILHTNTCNNYTCLESHHHIDAPITNDVSMYYVVGSISRLDSTNISN